MDFKPKARGRSSTSPGLMLRGNNIARANVPMTHLFKRREGEWYRRSTGRRPDRTARVRWENHNQPLKGCAMKPNPKISAAVAAILSAPATAVVLAAAETATATGTPTELQEVIVTAERRAERSEEHTSELQSQSNLVCRLLLEKKKQFSK